MRVEPSHIIRITGRTGNADPIRELQKGSELTARIVERVGKRDAVLEIGGRRVRAEFVRGLPLSESLVLKLESISRGTYIFKIVDQHAAEEFIGRLAELTIFDAGDFSGSPPHALAAFLSKQPNGIFELNAFLVGILAKNEKPNDRIATVVNRLMSLGLTLDRALDLSMLLSDAGVGLKIILSLLALAGQGGGRAGKQPAKGRDPDEIAGDIADAIEGIEDEGRREEFIVDLVNILAGLSREPGVYQRGEIAFHRDGSFHPLRYMGGKKSWVFSIEFSVIGRVDILLKDVGPACHISIFCEKNDVVLSFKESCGPLLDSLGMINANIHIDFYNMYNSLNKIVEIYSLHPLHSVFDMKA
jgi:hypothetical protein